MRRDAFFAMVLTALLGVTVWGCFGMARHIIVAVDKLGDAGAGLAQTAAKLNGPHGTIAMTDEDVGAAKSLIIHADLAARHEQQQLTTWDARGAVLFANLNGGVTDLRATVNALTQTANAATGSAQAAAGALAGVERTVAAAQPLLSHSDAVVVDLDRRVNDPRVDALLADMHSEMVSANAITADARRVADDATAKYFKPLPWYRKALPYLTTGAKIAAYALPWP
jgi:hypothetical protein